MRKLEASFKRVSISPYTFRFEVKDINKKGKLVPILVVEMHERSIEKRSKQALIDMGIEITDVNIDRKRIEKNKRCGDCMFQVIDPYGDHYCKITGLHARTSLKCHSLKVVGKEMYCTKHIYSKFNAENLNA